MRNSTYDRLKYLAQIVLPGFATLYFALSETWGFAYGAETVATITAFNTFLGVILGLTAKSYLNSPERFDGVVEIHEDESTKRMNVDFTKDPYDFDSQEAVVLRVVNNPRG